MTVCDIEAFVFGDFFHRESCHDSVVHLLFPVWTDLATNRFIFDAVPNDGPHGAVRVIVRGDHDLPGVQPTTYWSDPDHDYCVLKVVQPVISKESGQPELAYVDTEEFSDYAESPNGHWYPQSTRRSLSTDSTVQIRRYYVDFEAKFADDLFQPTGK